MIDSIFQLVEAPLTAGGLIPICRWGASSNWLPDASARMLHQVYRSIPGTDRRWWRQQGRPSRNQANDENGVAINEERMPLRGGID